MVTIVELADIKLEAGNMLEFLERVEIWRNKQGASKVCLSLGKWGFVFKKIGSLPIWIPWFPLFPSKGCPTAAIKTAEHSNYKSIALHVRNAGRFSLEAIPQNMIRLDDAIRIGEIQLPTSCSLSCQGSDVLLPGSFDILHQGHINLFIMSRCLGSRLIAILDSDERITSRKGPCRPFYPLRKRIKNVKKIKIIEETRVLRRQNEFENILKDYSNPIVVKGSEYRGGFLEYKNRISKNWTALCIESHSSARSSVFF